MRAAKRGLRAAVLLLMGFLCTMGVAQAGQPDAGTVAPPFTLQDLDGHVVSLSDYRGKVVVLTFWGTACREALEAQFPALQERIYDVYPREQLEILSVNITTDSEVEQLKECRDALGVTFPVLVGGLRASMEYGIFSTPNVVLIDREGVIRYQEAGKPFNEQVMADLTHRIEALGVSRMRAGVGQRAPDFTLPQLDGEPVSLSDALSQYDVVLLYFFYAAT